MTNTARQRLATSDTNYGVVGNNTVRTAAQIGNATGQADFGSGLTTIQTLRVTLATDTVIQVDTSPGTGVYVFGENVAVAPASTVVLGSFTPAVTYYLMRVTASGDADGEFFVRIGGTVIAKKRNNWTERNVDFEWGKNGIPITVGTLVELLVTHKGKTTSSFNTTIYGEEP